MDVYGLLRSAGIYSLYAALLYFLLKLTYRFFFHPLRDYPGPLAARLTSAFGGFQAAARKTHITIQLNHEKYGPVVRVAPNRLVFNTLTALHDIYNNPLVNKSHVYVLTRMTPRADVFNTLDIDQHRRKRKIISQPISQRSSQILEPVVLDQIDIFLRQLHLAAEKSDPVNIAQRTGYLSSDIIGYISFGYDLKTQTEELNRWLLWGLTFTAMRLNVYMQSPPIAAIEPMVRLLGSSMRKRYLGILETMIGARTALDVDAKRDLYSFAANTMESGKGRTSELWAESLFFITAGGATTAAAISAVFFYLSRNPSCYEALTEEIRDTFESAEEIQLGKKLQVCKYLRACIDEALRMSPPTVGMLWREELRPEEGGTGAPLIIDGRVIPRGTQVAVNLYALHHNEDYFPDSFAYKPERWLTAEAQDPGSMMQRAFAPFGIGGRSCAGKAIAYLEMSLTLAKTMYLFDFEIPIGAQGHIGAGGTEQGVGRHREDEYQLYDIFTSHHDGPLLLFKPRDSLKA